MICDKIIYNDETIITMLHKGFPDEKSTPERFISETINGTKIAFKEYYESSEYIVDDCICIDEGFLDVKSNMNPYKSASNCAIYKRYDGKIPTSLFKVSDEDIALKISLEDAEKVFSFIKKYTNIDAGSDISLLGDTLEYELRKPNVKNNITGRYIEFDNLTPNMCISVNFYKQSTIVSSEVYTTDKSSTAYKFFTPDEWGYADITIYKDGKLYYKNSTFSLIKSISISMCTYTTKSVNLDNFRVVSKINSYSSNEFTVGDKNTLSKTETSLSLIQHQINLNRQKKRIQFFKPNEEKRVLEEIAEIFSNAGEELLVFDPYFADGKSIGLNRDILKLINSCNSKSKVVTFYSRDSNYINNLNSTLFNCEYFQNNLKNSELNITFKQTNQPIHDRFIIAKNSKDLFAYVIGTSLNSIDDNYFCIIKLDNADSSVIYNELKGLIFDDSFCATKEY